MLRTKLKAVKEHAFTDGPVSISSRVVEHVRNTDKTHFTAHDVVTALGLPDKALGGVTSTLARARKLGLIELVGTSEPGVNSRGRLHRGAFQYSVLDKHAKVRVLTKPGQGGVAGALRKKHKRAVPPHNGAPTIEEKLANANKFAPDLNSYFGDPSYVDEHKNILNKFPKPAPTPPAPENPFLAMAEQLLNMAVELQRAAAAPTDLSKVSSHALLAELTKRMPE